MASTLNRSLHLGMIQIPECVVASYVDTATSMLLSVKTVDSHPQEVLDVLAAASANDGMVIAKSRGFMASVDGSL
jgi:hypothetical protein